MPWLIVSERGEPMTRKGMWYLVQTIGERSTLPFSVHPHMLRHGCGYEILERTGDVRLAQEYLGHKDIKNTT
ncbi:MAG: tyrosine-type recombinase/integrase, partial [Flavobacteriaceae bacterium]|nr:tyrosine-type recombinase/integrase [Flavobacteriaceae bacterium]